ncbi:hypothetical protein L7F22_067281 [Adiantum nelumboides]|nr:hypothetical protein [Adiantum nelumboides]
MKQFLARDAKDKVLTKWRSLKLTPYESIHKYVDKFWDLHLKATVYKKIDFEEQKQQFCAGLPEDMNEYVNSQRPRSISAVIHHTMVAARINFQQGAKRNLKPMEAKEKQEYKEDIELIQLMVKTIFLHGDLHEDIYMQQPEGFVVIGKEHLVCKLKESLYGLLQAPRELYQKFHTFMLSQGYKRSDIDHCLYTKQAKDGSLLILILHVDDMLLARKNIDELVDLQSRLNDNFDMKDLGDANHILGMQIVRDSDKQLPYLSQTEYINKVLNHFNMEEGNALCTPLPPYVRLCINYCPTFDAKKAEMAKVPSRYS